MVSGITIAPTRSQNSRSSSTQQIPEKWQRKDFDFRQFLDEASLNAELKSCSRCSDWGDGAKKCEQKEKLTEREKFRGLNDKVKLYTWTHFYLITWNIKYVLE